MTHETETGDYKEWVPHFSAGDRSGISSSIRDSFNINLGEKLKSWLMAVAFVSAIAGNLIFGVLYLQAERKLTTQEDLNKYAFDFFKQNDWIKMQTDVEVTKQLIAAKCSK